MMRLGVEPREDRDDALEVPCSMAGGGGPPFGRGEARAGCSGAEGPMSSGVGAGEGAAAEAGISMLLEHSAKPGL